MTDETPDPEDAPVAGPDAVTGDHSATGDEATDESAEVPEDVIDEVERLTRLAREASEARSTSNASGVTASDEQEAAAYRERRESLLAEYDFTTRVRDDDTHDTLVLHPEEWLEDGVVQMDAIEDVDRGIERPLGGPGDGEEWDAIAERNREIAEAVAAEHGEVHGENAAALAAFMNNHYAKPIDSATDDEIEEFVAEYFPRNAWPSERQRDQVDRSVALTLEIADSV